MPEAGVHVCASEALIDGGTGVRFPVATRRGRTTAFVVRHRGTVHGYVNQCAHAGTELDWQPGEFFDRSGLWLMCAVHGAIYEPDTGRCAGGPCRGQSLKAVPVGERDGEVVWFPNHELTPGDAAPPSPGIGHPR